MANVSVMTPGHAHWGEFIARLSESRTCLQTTEQARALLEEWAEVDVEQSLRALRDLGGYCDCEIVNGVGGSHWDPALWVDP